VQWLALGPNSRCPRAAPHSSSRSCYGHLFERAAIEQWLADRCARPHLSPFRRRPRPGRGDAVGRPQTPPGHCHPLRTGSVHSDSGGLGFVRLLTCMTCTIQILDRHVGYWVNTAFCVSQLLNDQTVFYEKLIEATNVLFEFY
jgi:hypothetical protein